MKRILAFLALALVVFFGGAAAAQTRTQYAGQPYTQAGTPLLAFAHQNLGDLKVGETAISRFDYNPATFPAGFSAYETWPTRFTGGVRSWSSVQWNRYYGWGTSPSAPLAPVRLADIGTLAVDYDAVITGDANLLLDWFLTDAPNDMSTVRAEIEVLPNPSASARAWAKAGVSLGPVGPWTASYMSFGSATIFYLVPTVGVRNKGQIDMRATMLWLAEKTRLIDGSDYLNGFGFGVEAVSGTSTTTIRDMRVTFARKP